MKPMKKWGLVLAIFLLTACSEEQQVNEPTRVQLEKLNMPDAIEIFEEAEVELVASALGQVKWQPNVEAETARIEDVELRLFIEKDPNMPAYIITYRIWIENDKSFKPVFLFSKATLPDLQIRDILDRKYYEVETV